MFIIHVHGIVFNVLILSFHSFVVKIPGPGKATQWSVWTNRTDIRRVQNLRGPQKTRDWSHTKTNGGLYFLKESTKICPYCKSILFYSILLQIKV